jgi:Holliday junction resolvase RusA-like endonuclease
MLMSFFIPGIPQWTHYKPTDYGKRFKLAVEPEQWKETIRNTILQIGRPDERLTAVPVFCRIVVVRPRGRFKGKWPLMAPDTKNYFACAEDAISKFLESDDSINVAISCIKIFEGTHYPATEYTPEIQPHPPGVLIQLDRLEENYGN